MNRPTSNPRMAGSRKAGLALVLFWVAGANGAESSGVHANAAVPVPECCSLTADAPTAPMTITLVPGRWDLRNSAVPTLVVRSPLLASPAGTSEEFGVPLDAELAQNKSLFRERAMDWVVNYSVAVAADTEMMENTDDLHLEWQARFR